ncbi:MAG: 16S rRNA (guanine(966)-N(2))-methyltransferase RsmD [gamma proteobacterium symbiont of Phacoides pectinatus]
MARRPTRGGSGAGRRPGHGNQVRIIGGEHRGRRLRFPDQPGLRPTSDRVRETLFNWLQPWLPGARVLDLFAGSGALGFEAASRGAARVVMLERAAAVAARLEENRRLLDLEQVEILRADALEWLAGTGEPFDVVFLDPPFAESLLDACCSGLESSGWLERDALVYIEHAAQAPPPNLPMAWKPLKEKRAGDVSYGLYRPNPDDSGTPRGLREIANCHLTSAWH